MRPIPLFLSMVATCLCATAAGAQGPQPAITLDEVLKALQHNVADYIASLPNLYCDEHVSSDFTPHGSNSQRQHTVVDATFRIRRPPVANTLADFKESRDIKLVDGQPIVDENGFPRNTDLPLLILGVFANAPALFSPSLQPCFDFLLLNPAATDAPDTVTLQFGSKPQKDRPASCPNDHPSRGLAVLDRTTLHLLHLEKITPKFPIYPEKQGTWHWTVDYAPTSLAGRKFWLPSHILSTSVADHGHDTWTFDAAYTNYHRLLATSRILPNAQAPAPPH